MCYRIGFGQMLLEQGECGSCACVRAAAVWLVLRWGECMGSRARVWEGETVLFFV